MKNQDLALTILAYETQKIELDVLSSARIASKKVYGKNNLQNIALAVYGSPGRREIVGGDSDADILMICKSWDKQTIKFRKEFIEAMDQTHNYSKIDLPNWGSIDECELYLSRSLVEGNQILETRFITGDYSLWIRLNELKNEYHVPQRVLEKIFFNRFYFFQEASLKNADSLRNIKYTRGGTRDFLLVGWYFDLMKLLGEEIPSEFNKPKYMKGLRMLLRMGVIDLNEYMKCNEAFSFFILLRREVLIVNKLNGKKAKSILDDDACKLLEKRGFMDCEDLVRKFDESRKISRKVIDKLFEECTKIQGMKLAKKIKSLLADISISDRKKDIRERNKLSTLANIYGATKHNQPKIIREVFESYIDSGEWSILGLLAASHLSDQFIIDKIVEKYCSKKGFEYIMRIASKNPNISRKSLRTIVETKHIDERYKNIAFERLENKTYEPIHY